MATVLVDVNDSVDVVQAKLNSCAAGDTLLFPPVASTFDFQGRSLRGKSGILVKADRTTTIVNADPNGAFDFSGLQDWTLRGTNLNRIFKIEDAAINANGAARFTVSYTQLDRGGGSDTVQGIRLLGASQGRVQSCTAIDVDGITCGWFDTDRIVFVNNLFDHCTQPFSLQYPKTADTSLGRWMRWTNNMFTRTRRVAIECGPSSTGAEYMANTIVERNIFDAFANASDADACIAISLVAQAMTKTRVSDNFIRFGNSPIYVPLAAAIEFTGDGECYGNTIWGSDAGNCDAGYTYKRNWNVHDNTLYRVHSNFFYNDAPPQIGTFSNNTQVSVAPAVPVWTRT